MIHPLCPSPGTSNVNINGGMAITISASRFQNDIHLRKHAPKNGGKNIFARATDGRITCFGCSKKSNKYLIIFEVSILQAAMRDEATTVFDCISGLPTLLLS